ncbi:MAG TPA: phage holin family protein [Longimicrobium sp.]|nr:phage holin family protein [Longimicrobium sp.]
MSLHLFSTPVQCTRCGTVVDDPTVDKCPTCGNLLKERRAPRRLAGVETRYSGLRTLLGVLRFLGVLVLMLGGLVFFSTLGDDGLSGTQGAAMFVGSIVVAVLMFAAAGAFVLMMDIEENTRSSFRMQQRMLELMDSGRPEGAPTAGEGSVEVPPAPARQTL